MYSLWSDTAQLPHFDRLEKDLHVDVLVIGGGIAGILCAFKLQQAGISYALAEADTICSGITKNTTAKITAQHGLIYDKLLRKYGKNAAKLYLEANENALAQYRTLCRSIDCSFEAQDNFVYATDNPADLHRELAALRKIGAAAQWTDRIPVPVPAVGAIRFPNEAQFHPLQFLAAISRDLHIYEHTAVTELIGSTALTPHGKIFAEKIIVATHFPMLNKHGSYFMKLYQHRSYVIALEDAQPFSGMYVDAAQNGLSFRMADGLLLLGGGDHRTGKKGGNWKELEVFAQKHYPNAKIKYRWATQDCMSLDGIAYIGNYSARTPDLYTATGFNKWGMTTAMVAADILCDLVQGKHNPYARLYSPSRTMLHPLLATNAFESAVGLLTPTKKRCPHLGCALKWNPAEHSWDCPCHGSRFAEDGALIDNPATGDLPD